MSVIRKTYENRQAGFTDRYGVEFHQDEPNGKVTTFIPVCPQDPHGKSVDEHHRFANGKLCVAAGKEPRSFEAAEAVAQYWMSKYSEYVRSSDGKFRDTGGRVNV